MVNRLVPHVVSLALIGCFGLIAYIWFAIGPAVQANTTIDTNTYLESIQRQNKLVPLKIRFVAIAETSRTQYRWINYRYTTIGVGVVDYQIDLNKLTKKDITFNHNTNTLDVRLPPIEVQPPNIDVTKLRTYSNEGIFNSPVYDTLYRGNLNAIITDIVHQSNTEQQLKYARDAAIGAMTTNISLLNSNIRVTVHF